MPRFRFFLAVFGVLCGVSSLEAQSTPTIAVFPSLAPNAFGSPSFPQWESNTITALQLGQSSLGSPTQPTYYQQIANGAIIQPWVATEFPSWMLKADPSTAFGPAFANELGNRLYFNLHIVGNGTQFSIAQLSLTATSSDSGNVLGFTVSAGTYQYNSGYVGLNYGPDGIKGNADDVFITSGANTQPIDELFARGSGNAPEASNSDPGATDQEKIDLVVAGLPTPFTFTGGYSLSTDAGTSTGSAFVQVVGVPEPTTVVMTAAGAAGLAAGCYSYRRRRRRRRADQKVGRVGPQLAHRPAPRSACPGNRLSRPRAPEHEP